VNALRGLRTAFSYFSILPLPSNDPPDAAAMAWLPFVGAVTAALAGTAGYLVSLVAPHPLAVATAFTLSIVLTGAIHLDGFLDGCDAFFASVSPARRFEILDDPRHGTFAVAGAAIVGVVWLAALWSLPPRTFPFALTFAAVSARLFAVANALYIPYGRTTPSRAFESRLPVWIVILDAILAGVLAAHFGIVRGGLGLVTTLVAVTACVAWIRPRLGGGLTGDAYGFTIVVAEAATLVALAA
jgi:adenosylcobinamide-GDP ribazoletransferase